MGLASTSELRSAAIACELARTIRVAGAGLLLLLLTTQRSTAVCVGDCGANDAVTVDELVIGVNIALGNTSFDACPAFDTNHDTAVTVDELISGVNNALNGCPMDTDGNGIPDSVECGPVPAVCRDTDGDTVADFEDRDDDDDGLLDVNDPARVEPVVDADPFDRKARLFLAEARLDVAPANAPEDVARIGDTLVLVGEGFDPTATANVALFDGESGSQNVKPTAGSTTTLTVVVPAGARSPVRVATGGRRSGALTLRLLPAGAPVLFPLGDPSLSVGETVSLRGLDLGAVAAVDFGGASAAPLSTSANQLQVVVPAAARTGNLAVRSAAVASNPVLLRVAGETDAQVVAPPGAALAVTDLLVSAGIEADTHPDASGRTRVRTNRSGADLVTASVAGADGRASALYLEAVTVPGDTLVRLDTTSTAVALLVALTDLMAGGDPAAIATARTQLAALPAVQALAAAIAAGLAADPAFLRAPPASFDPIFVAALTAANPILEAALPTLPAASLRGSAAAEPAPGQATVDPTGGGDCPETILPACGEQSDVLVKQIAGTGNVTLENDSMVYLSVSIRDIERGWVLVPHARTWFDDSIIGTQEGLLWGFNAATRDYAHPNYRSAAVDVITGGLLSPNPPAGGDQIQFVLVIRTLVEKVILPPLTAVIGVVLDRRTNQEDGTVLLKKIITVIAEQYPDYEQSLREYVRSGDARGALDLLVSILKIDFTTVGPISRAVAEWALGRVGGEVIQNFVSSLLVKFVPVANSIQLAIKTVNVAAKATNAIKAVVDLLTTPAFVHFDVFFRPVITALQPTTIERVPEPRVIAIHGFNLYPPLGVLPVVTLTDRGGGLFPVVRTPESLELLQVDPDGRRILIGLYSAYVANVSGPIGLTVKRGNEEVAAAEDIQVTGVIEITRLSPPSGGPGTAIEIVGTGFNGDPAADLRVRFRDAPGPDPRQLDATDVVVESPTLLRARVPNLPADQAGWRVFVEQGSLTRRVISNSVDFFSSAYVPPPPGVIRFWTVDSTVELASATLRLTPGGNVFDGATQQMIGTWSAGDGSLKITACRYAGTTSFIEFEGTYDPTGSQFQVCCVDGGAGGTCGPRPCGGGGCDPRPCPAIRGTLKAYVIDLPQGTVREVFSRQVDNRYYAGDRYLAFRPDGFDPLPASLDWTCPAACGQFWGHREPDPVCRCYGGCMP